MLSPKVGTSWRCEGKGKERREQSSRRLHKLTEWGIKLVNTGITLNAHKLIVDCLSVCLPFLLEIRTLPEPHPKNTAFSPLFWTLSQYVQTYVQVDQEGQP